jgi:type IV pilus assembly protein PilZ
MMSAGDDSDRPGPRREKRAAARVAVLWAVDCETEDTFLYASITNISELGIFVATDSPLPVGTELTLRFAPAGWEEEFVLRGQVQWTNELRADGDDINPGMGVKFIELSLADRERLVEAIRTIAYLPGEPLDIN